MNLFTKHKLTDIGNKIMLTKEERGEDKLGIWD